MGERRRDYDFLGYAGTAHLVDCDGESALHSYSCENWNDPNNNNNNNPIEDGWIYIEFEPVASARKIVRTKRYPDGIPPRWAENVNYGQMLDDGTLVIRNCSNATRFLPGGVDRQALQLVMEIALDIQRDGVFPSSMAYVQ